MTNPIQLVRDQQTNVDRDPKLTTVYMLQTEINEHERIAREYREAEEYARRMAQAEEEIVSHLRISVAGLRK